LAGIKVVVLDCGRIEQSWGHVLGAAGATVIRRNTTIDDLASLFQKHARQQVGDSVDMGAGMVCMLCDYDWEAGKGKAGEGCRRRCQLAAEHNVPSVTFEWVMQCLIQQRRIPFDQHNRFKSLAPGIAAEQLAGRASGARRGAESVFHFVTDRDKGGSRYEVGEIALLKTPDATDDDTEHAQTFGRILAITRTTDPGSSVSLHHLRWKRYTQMKGNVLLPLDEEEEGPAEVIEGKCLVLTEQQYKQRDYQGDGSIYYIPGR
jgi:hypothetical protein